MKKGMIPSLWKVAHATGKSPLDLLVYRSNLLGTDPRIVNTGGGNTSAKLWAKDPLTGKRVKVLWVKGSGGDMRTAGRANFASLYMEKILLLKDRYKGPKQEDEMVSYYLHAIFDLNPRPASIDTPLHAFIPFDHVDHTHPDSVIAIAASSRSKQLTERIYKGVLGWLPWRRPGFQLAMDIKNLIERQPNIKGVMLEGHGLINWAKTSRDCYELSLKLINRAAVYLRSKDKGRRTFGGLKKTAKNINLESFRTEFLPVLRGKLRYGRMGLVHWDQSPEVMEFIHSRDASRLAKLGTSCPDHFLRTKIRPLLLPANITEQRGAKLGQSLDKLLGGYRKEYEAYYKKYKNKNTAKIRNPNPSVILVPGLGMVTSGQDKKTALITAEFYTRAIAVMRGAEAVDRYVALPSREAFRIEYWELEEAKLKRLPLPAALSGQVALVTGAARGIGLATSEKLLELGAHVALGDIDKKALKTVTEDLVARYGEDRVLSLNFDVTQTRSVDKAIEDLVQTFGGLDILVSNAGLARRGSILKATDQDYKALESVLMKGYFLVSRAAARIMRAQESGQIVFVVSKNAVAAGQNASIYSAAKAFELHLMRTMASDLGPLGIRCNAVNPDGVLAGSGIWSKQWRYETASLLGMAPNQLEEHYRKRSLLGVSIYPQDIAEAVSFLASPSASKITGCTLTVDGGIREGFLR